MTTATGDTLQMNYDVLRRLSSVSSDMYTKEYYYEDISDRTTGLVSSLWYAGLPTTFEFIYTYDDLGNIAAYEVPDQDNIIYTYDDLGQLLSAVGNQTYTYTYDSAGNILTANGHTYTYGNANWKDLLTAFDGRSITYDASGNPLSYYNGIRWNFTWKNGRNLLSARSANKTIAFEYDSNGLRTGKTVDGVAHNYFYAGGQLLRETYEDIILDFFYDANGYPYALSYNDTTYYYITNLQGDVVYLINGGGETVASYEYDPYGNILSATGEMAEINPLRYRGYYYDSELEMYYLQSRYYDPMVGRFINADALVSTGQGVLGHNMFVYCGNNPINCFDDLGNAWKSIWSRFKNAVSSVLHKNNDRLRSIGFDTARLGAIFLQFEKKGNTYHATFDCWQQYFGYNSMYDFMFDIGTDMLTRQFTFNTPSTEYIIWIWKGDYINLGAGAEIGIYYGGGPHWKVSKNLKMKMSMSVSRGGKHLFSYTDTTWWLTGFMPSEQYAMASELTVVYTIWFNDRTMYEAFKKGDTGGWIFYSGTMTAQYLF